MNTYKELYITYSRVIKQKGIIHIQNPICDSINDIYKDILELKRTEDNPYKTDKFAHKMRQTFVTYEKEEEENKKKYTTQVCTYAYDHPIILLQSFEIALHYSKKYYTIYITPVIPEEEVIYDSRGENQVGTTKYDEDKHKTKIFGIAMAGDIVLKVPSVVLYRRQKSNIYSQKFSFDRAVQMHVKKEEFSMLTDFHMRLIQDLTQTKDIPHSFDMGQENKHYLILPLIRKVGEDKKISYSIDMETVRESNKKNAITINQYIKMQKFGYGGDMKMALNDAMKCIWFSSYKPFLHYRFADQIMLTAKAKHLFRNIDTSEKNTILEKHTVEEILQNPELIKMFENIKQYKGICKDYLKYPNVEEEILSNPIILLKIINASEYKRIKNDLRLLRLLKTNDSEPKEYPLFHPHLVQKHYLSFFQWNMLECFYSILPHFEKALLTVELLGVLGIKIDVGRTIKSTTVNSSNAKESLETYETFGDSILKFAATWACHKYGEYHAPNKSEGYLTNLRSSMINNYYLSVVGNSNKLYRYLRADSMDNYKWRIPYFDRSVEKHSFHFKNKDMADCVEALIANVYRCTNTLSKACRLIENLGILPLTEDFFKILETHDNVLYNLDINSYNFDERDSLIHIISKYTQVHKIKNQRILKFDALMAQISNDKYRPFCAYSKIKESSLYKILSNDQFESIISMLENDILCYKFNNRSLLIEAFTHSSIVTYGDNKPYEKLELLGDAILECIVSCHLLWYCETTITSPLGAHESKRMLVNNDILAKISYLVGLPKYLLADTTRLDEDDIDKFIKEYDCTTFLPFDFNYQEAACPKIFSDIYESLMGAVFIDSRSLKTTLDVFEPLLAPLLAFNIKFQGRFPRQICEEMTHLFQTENYYPKFLDETNSNGDMQISKVIIMNNEIARGTGDTIIQARRNAALMAIKEFRRSVKEHEDASNEVVDMEIDS